MLRQARTNVLPEQGGPSQSAQKPVIKCHVELKALANGGRAYLVRNDR